MYCKMSFSYLLHSHCNESVYKKIFRRENEMSPRGTGKSPNVRLGNRLISMSGWNDTHFNLNFSIMQTKFLCACSQACYKKKRKRATKWLLTPTCISFWTQTIADSHKDLGSRISCRLPYVDASSTCNRGSWKKSFLW